jgi:hypothetical protein
MKIKSAERLLFVAIVTSAVVAQLRVRRVRPQLPGRRKQRNTNTRATRGRATKNTTACCAQRATAGVTRVRQMATAVRSTA